MVIIYRAVSTIVIIISYYVGHMIWQYPTRYTYMVSIKKFYKTQTIHNNVKKSKIGLKKKYTRECGNYFELKNRSKFVGFESWNFMTKK